MTTTPNALVGMINHERMPVLLSTDERHGGRGLSKSIRRTECG
jgi:hypothetical protein